MPLELCGVDVILGMQWLQKMGTMKVNWGSLSMTFESEGGIIEIKGDLALTRATILTIEDANISFTIFSYVCLVF